MAALASPAAVALERAALVAPFAREYPFTSRVLDLDGLAYHYLDEGPRDAPPLLLVHGNPTWSFLWRHAIKAFRGEMRCVAPDHIGCGLSDKPRDYPYRLAAHIENLERLALELDLERITLAVHDWGGPIGLGFAARHPERIARLMVLNTSAFPLDGWGGRAPWRLRACRAPLLGDLAVQRLNAFARLAPWLALEDRSVLSREARRGFLAPYSERGARTAALRFVQDIPLSSGHPSYATLCEVERGLELFRRTPLCLIWGERDWCFTPAFRREWQRRFPEASVHRAERAGHWVLEDAREDVLRWMRAFLAANPIAGPPPPAPPATLPTEPAKER
jgi:pimeloyl-ACP methyl ester carboxylesterase